MQEPISELPADDAELLDLASVMGQCHTFGVVAGRCSAAQAATLKCLREERCYLRVSANWRSFRAEYLKMSQTQADPSYPARLLEGENLTQMHQVFSLKESKGRVRRG